MAKDERMSSIARVKYTLKYGKRTENLKNIKNGLFSDGEQTDAIEPSHTALDFFFLFSFCYHLFSL